MDNKSDFDEDKSPAPPPKDQALTQVKQPKKRSKWLTVALAAVLLDVMVGLVVVFPAVFKGVDPLLAPLVTPADTVTLLGPVTGVHYLSSIDFETQVDTPKRSVLVRGVFNVENGAVLEIHATNSGESRICEAGTSRCAHWYGAHD